MFKKSIYSLRSIRLGNWLRSKRELKELSLREYQKVTGWSHSSLQKVETGHRRLDVVEYLYLCESLDANPLVIPPKNKGIYK